MLNGDNTVATLVRSLRVRRGWSQNQLAQHAEIGSSTISRIEAGIISSPGVDVLRKISSALGVDISEITGDRPMQPRQPEVVGGAVRLPILKRRVHAGGQADWGDTGQDFFVPVRFHDLHPRAQVAIVDGNCMDPHIKPGERVIFDPDRKPVNGQMVVVTTIDGQMLLKWFRLDAEGQPFLRSADGEEIRPNGARIAGVVLEVHRGAIRDPQA